VKGILERLVHIDTTAVPISEDCDANTLFGMFGKSATSEEVTKVFESLLMGNQQTVKHYHLLTTFHFYKV
jgi:hypothetical protein